MDALIERVIADFHERDLPALTRRHIAMPWLDGKVDSVIGMRRAGKTWFLYQTIRDLLDEGADKRAVVYINFEDDRLWPIAAADLHQIPDTYYRLYPDMRQERVAFFFDEIQAVEGWERFVRRLVDTESAHVCVTGSSSRLLSREIATSLRGRALSTEVFPFSFAESLDHAGIRATKHDPPGARLRSKLQHHFREYLIRGGFPEIQGLDTELRLRILRDYLDVVILRDVIERGRISNTAALRYLVRHLLGNPASLFSVNKTYRDMRSQGLAVSKDSLYEMLDLLVDAFLFFPIEIHASSQRARQVNPRKVYTIDTGLARATSKRAMPDVGHLLENVVFVDLRRRRNELVYYRTASGREVDFLVTGPAGEQSLVQACADASNQVTREREVEGLFEAMGETGIEEGVVVTMDEEDRFERHGCLIQLIPAWRWLLR